MSKYLFLAIFLLFISCGKKEKPVVVPNDVLSIEQMINIGTEINIIKAASETRLSNGKRKQENIDSYMKSIFKENEVTQELYSKSFDWYATQPKMFSKVYNGIIEKLSQREVELLNKSAKRNRAK
ncbi:MAG: DUF4296 domain-containing protein [Flavobacteriales bacterium]|nr:DUF4296 domain-containing protein [Flavobacteriales bacterium]